MKVFKKTISLAMLLSIMGLSAQAQKRGRPESPDASAPAASTAEASTKVEAENAAAALRKAAAVESFACVFGMTEGDVLSDIRKNMAVLKELSITYNNCLTTKGIATVLQECIHLTKLEADSCYSIVSVAEDLPEGLVLKLEELDLTRTGINSEQLAAFMGFCPFLKKLILKSCDGAVGFVSYLAHPSLPRLEELDITYTEAKAEDIAAVIRLCPSLKKLTMKFCDPAFVDFFESDFVSNLQELDLMWTNATPEQLAKIKMHFPACRVVSC